MAITPSPKYLLAVDANKAFENWLTQHMPLPEEPGAAHLIDLLESAFIAGYFRNDND